MSVGMTVAEAAAMPVRLLEADPVTWHWMWEDGDLLDVAFAQLAPRRVEGER